MHRAILSRALRAASCMPAPDARRVVSLLISSYPAPILAGARSDKRAQLAARHYTARQPAIKRMHDAIARHLDYAKSETLRNLEGIAPSMPRRAVRARSAGEPIVSAAGPGVAGDIAFDPQRFGDGLLAAIRNESADTLQEAGEQLYDEAGIDDPFSMPAPRALKFLDRRANLLKDIPDEVHRAIEDELQAGLTAGDSMQKLANRLSSKFAEIEEGRAQTIASTETAAAYGYARQDAMTQAGITHKAWLTSHLPNVRPAHAEAETDPRNERVPVDEPFLVGGEKLMYPGDEAGSPENVINCHCVALSLPTASD